MSSEIPQHSSKTDLWYTPIPIVEKVREVLGGKIDLDPASDAFGNSRIKATTYYTENIDGLTKTWSGRIFLNPPGGKIGNKSRMKLFWQRLMVFRETGHLNDAIFLAFSLEALSTTQEDPEFTDPIKPHASMCEFTVCIPRSRIRFDGPDGVSQKSPTHANAIVYVPGRTDVSAYFVKVFSSLGDCMQRQYPL
jgi:hypothetical protein